jgi:hypothetical protein
VWKEGVIGSRPRLMLTLATSRHDGPAEGGPIVGPGWNADLPGGLRGGRHRGGLQLVSSQRQR